MGKKNGRTGFLLVVPSLAGVCAFYVVPFLSSLYYTFTQGVSEPRFVGLANFRELLDSPVFRQAVGNTALFLILGVPLALAGAVLLSVALAKGGFSWQRWALLLPFVLPASSLAVAWQGLWGRETLNGPAALPITLLLYLLRNAGYLSVILTGAIRALPGEYRESCFLDGCGEGRYLFHVLIPLLSPTLLFAGIVAVMNYFLLFRDVYMLYGDSPPRRLYMLQHFMNSSFYKLNYQRLSAAAFVTVLALSALVAAVLLLQRRVKSHVE
ncbi:MAG: sugar ABC transporter permease [Oscillospiraceae bacterium]|nr:sugar ABC transporter permease [Oscillospiraceae bacterium]